MKCQGCDEQEATVHFKEVADGELHEIHLCEACAAERGFHLVIEKNKLSIASQFIWMAENLFPESSAKVGAVQCAACGLRYSQFARTGRLGCPDCYPAFSAQLERILRRVHGATRHKGRGPGTEAGAVTTALATTRNEIEELRRALSRAIEQEEFEEAARIRDQIRRLESDPPSIGPSESQDGGEP